MTAAKTQAETGKILQEMERVASENDRLKLEYAQMQQQIVQHIEAQLDSIQYAVDLSNSQR